MTSLKKINKNQFLALPFCEDKGAKKNILKFYGTKERLTAIEMLPFVKTREFRLNFLRPELFDSNDIHSLVCEFVEHVLDVCGENKDELIHNIRLKKKWINGQVSNAELRKQFLKSDIWLRRYVLSRFSESAYLVARMCREFSPNPRLELAWQLNHMDKWVNNVNS